MAKPLKFGNASLCEYVAKGAGNKHTLVNVFSGDVIVSEFPANIMFGIYLEYMQEPTDVPSLTIEIIIDGNAIATLPVNIAPGEDGRPLNIVIQSMALSLEKDTTLEVVASAPRRRRTTVLSKRLYKGIIPQSP